MLVPAMSRHASVHVPISVQSRCNARSAFGDLLILARLIRKKQEDIPNPLETKQVQFAYNLFRIPAAPVQQHFGVYIHPRHHTANLSNRFVYYPSLHFATPKCAAQLGNIDLCPRSDVHPYISLAEFLIPRYRGLAARPANKYRPRVSSCGNIHGGHCTNNKWH